MEIKIGKLKIISCILLIFALLSACASGEAEKPSDNITSASTVPIAPGEPMIYGINQRFGEAAEQYSDWQEKQVGWDGVEHWDNGFISSDCFLKRQDIVKPLFQAKICFMEGGEEISYALRDPIIGAPELTNEERLELERQLQRYAQEKGLKYSYLYRRGFVVFVFTKEEPELWVHMVREAYNNSPEFGTDLEETEVKLQHQVLVEHTLIDMLKRMGDNS